MADLEDSVGGFVEIASLIGLRWRLPGDSFGDDVRIELVAWVG